MAMKGQETVTEAEVEKGIRGKLVEDLKAVVADAEELVKATASPYRGADRRRASQGGNIAEGREGPTRQAGRTR